MPVSWRVEEGSLYVGAVAVDLVCVLVQLLLSFVEELGGESLVLRRAVLIRVLSLLCRGEDYRLWDVFHRLAHVRREFLGELRYRGVGLGARPRQETHPPVVGCHRCRCLVCSAVRERLAAQRGWLLVQRLRVVMVLDHLLDLVLAESQVVAQRWLAWLSELAERGTLLPVRIWDLLSCLNLGETLLRIITVASYILQVAVKLWSPFAAADAAPQHVLAQLSFDLGVRY